MGWFTNPKKAAYNRVYNRTTTGCGCMFILIPTITSLGILVGLTGIAVGRLLT